ncbi:hypothetical protein JL722_13249 [Aureococcus anophagefferens]|nr:hypothetical protein JL722_13249 [Aureococcus anophagefferens]
MGSTFWAAAALLPLVLAYEEYPSLPNLPYTVDATRLSDGVSSVSPLTGTAPAFPIHRGDVSDAPDGRAVLAAAKRQSEVDQGVAAVGDGAYVREQRVDRLEEAGAWGPAPTRQFVVNASLRWNPSSFAIQRGETHRVDALGPQRWVDGFVKIDADGYPAHYDAISQCWVAAGRCRPYLGARKRLPDADCRALAYYELRRAGLPLRVRGDLAAGDRLAKPAFLGAGDAPTLVVGGAAGALAAYAAPRKPGWTPARTPTPRATTTTTTTTAPDDDLMNDGFGFGFP